MKAEAAVGGDDLSRDPASTGAEQVGRDRRDVFRATEPTGGATTTLGVECLKGEAAQQSVSTGPPRMALTVTRGARSVAR